MRGDRAVAGGAIIGAGDRVLVTGAAGFIGRSVVRTLVEYGFREVRCLVRSPRSADALEGLVASWGAGSRVEIARGNLLSADDCGAATEGVAVVYHLAAGTGEKSFPDAFLNSVVTTRNLLDGCRRHGGARRFVNIGSFAVYSNRSKPRGRVLDEAAPVEDRPELRGEAYCYAKVWQERLVEDYGRKHGIPYVLVRPGVVYGPGKDAISGRVGRSIFGVFLEFGSANRIPLTHVDNCAEAIVLAGLVRGVDGEVFNVVDDDLPSGRRFLRLYKERVRPVRSLRVPRPVSYLGCLCWEKAAAWSRGQLPPVFNRRAWHAYWKGNLPVNDKIKARLGWRQRIPTDQGLRMVFDAFARKSGGT